MEALESLRRRSLIEKSTALFTLQPVVMEYITEIIIEQICQEITTGEIALFMSHALMGANVKDYVRDIQIRLILKPIIKRLFSVFITQRNIEDKLIQILEPLRDKSLVKPGYAGSNVLNLLCQLQTDLTGYDFSYLAVRQAYLQNVNLHKVSFAHSDLTRSVFAKNFATVLSVTFSRDGQLLATGDANGEIRLWRVITGQQLLLFQGHTNKVWSVAFHANGTTLISGSEDQTVKIWDVQSGECLKTLLGHTDRIWSVDYSPQDDTIASASDDKTVRLWDANTGKCLKILKGHTNWVWSVDYSPQGDMIVSGSDDQTVRLWDVNTGQCLKTLKGHTD